MSAALQLPKVGPSGALQIEEEDLLYFCQVIEDRAGIALKPAKHDLVRTRIMSRLRVTGHPDFTSYRQWLQTLAPNDPEWEQFTNLLTTNKTDFFRERKHFDYLVDKILPEWLKLDRKTFKAWSAASSSGEEAFTLAMILHKHLPPDRDFKILGTDIDTNIIKVAQNAVYPISKKDEIPPEYHSYIEIGKREVSGWFRIKSYLKERIQFKPHNLIERSAPSENIFDLVLCRNVLIYFNSDNIDFVQRKLYTTVVPGGHLFIGHSESLQGLQHRWQSVGPSIFRKVER